MEEEQGLHQKINVIVKIHKDVKNTGFYGIQNVDQDFMLLDAVYALPIVLMG
jgi:hypothetical protein